MAEKKKYPIERVIVGYRLKKLREARRSTQRFCASAVGIPDSMYHRFETGQIILKEKYLKDIAELFNVPEEYLDYRVVNLDHFLPSTLLWLFDKKNGDKIVEAYVKDRKERLLKGEEL